MRKVAGITAAAILLVAQCLLLTSCRDAETNGNSPAAVSLCEEGTADLQAFRFAEAATKLGHCLEMDPTMVEAAISRTLALAGQQDVQSVSRELSRADSLTAALTDDKRRMIAQLRLSQITNSRFHTMGDSLRNQLGRELPDNFFVLEASATHAEHTGDGDAAAEIWQRVLRINPNHAAAYNNLGYLELGRGNYDQALEHLQKYIFLAPDLANPHDSYGEALMTVGRYEEAEQELRTAIGMQSDFYPSVIKLGRIYLARGQVKKGMMILGKVREQIAGSDMERQVNLRVISSLLASDYQPLLGQTTRKHIAHFPEDPLTPLLRTLVLSSNGHTTEAAAIMDSTLAARRGSKSYRNSADARTATELYANQYEGLRQDHLGNATAARKAWARSVELLQGNTPFHGQLFHRSHLAASNLAAGEIIAALNGIDAMLAVNPRLINVLLLKVQVHLVLNHDEEALAAQERLEWALSKADPGYPPRVRAAELAQQVAALANR